MRLGYFTMPLHPWQRDAVTTLQEDREAIILADQLGFYDAFVGEHLTDAAENVTNSFIFLATLIPETKQIKLCTGTSNLSHTHPTLIAMGERDFHPLSANFLLPQYLPSHWSNYAEGKRKVGQVANPQDWRVARTIFVADDSATAERYGRSDANSPYRYYWSQLRTKMMMAKRHVIFKKTADEDDSAVTVERLLDELVICGTVNQVVDGILKLHEEAGDFGELVYAGMDWVDPALSKRSMELMATEVMPRVNQALRESAPVVAKSKNSLD